MIENAIATGMKGQPHLIATGDMLLPNIEYPSRMSIGVKYLPWIPSITFAGNEVHVSNSITKMETSDTRAAQERDKVPALNSENLLCRSERTPSMKSRSPNRT